MENASEYVGYVTTAMVVLSQVAALIGVPGWVTKVKVANVIWNAVAANYGKAKNK